MPPPPPPMPGGRRDRLDAGRSSSGYALQHRAGPGPSSSCCELALARSARAARVMRGPLLTPCCRRRSRRCASVSRRRPDSCRACRRRRARARSASPADPSPPACAQRPGTPTRRRRARSSMPATEQRHDADDHQHAGQDDHRRGAPSTSAAWPCRRDRWDGRSHALDAPSTVAVRRRRCGGHARGRHLASALMQRARASASA